jgi:hypothetical protein
VDLLGWHGSVLCSLGRRGEGRAELRKAIAYSEGKDKVAPFLLAGTYSAELQGPPATGPHPEDKAGRALAKEVLTILGTLPNDEEFCKLKPNVRLLAAQAYYKLGEFAPAEKYVLEYMKLANQTERRQAQTILDLIKKSKAES